MMPAGSTSNAEGWLNVTVPANCDYLDCVTTFLAPESIKSGQAVVTATRTHSQPGSLTVVPLYSMGPGYSTRLVGQQRAALCACLVCSALGQRRVLVRA